MEHLKVAEGKASPKRELKFTRIRNQRVVMKSCSNMLDVIRQGTGGGRSFVSHASSENGVMKLKIVVRKQDLEEMLQRIRVVGGGKGKIIERDHSSVSNAQSVCLDQRLNLMKRRAYQRKWIRSNNNNNNDGHVKRSSWKPLLYSIPE